MTSRLNNGKRNRTWRRTACVLICLMLGLCSIAKVLGQSNKDLPPPTANLISIPSGSLVIAMDNTNQAIGAAFNLKAYGLVNNLLQNSIPIMWAIRAGKAKDATDFTVTAARIAPSATAATTYNFAGGPFIVHRDFAELAKVRITAFAKNVAVYQTTQDVTVDIRYDLTLKPNIAVSNVNTKLHTQILDDAAVPNYSTVDPTTLSAGSCYTSHSEPHTSATAGIPNVKAFVQSGGNFLAECLAVSTYENNASGKFMTTNGVVANNVGNALTYPNPDLSYSQFVGALTAAPGGSEQDWYLATGSSWQNGGHIHADDGVVSGKGQEFAASAAKLNGSGTPGGMVFYLGGHDWSGSSAIADLNGERMYLNFILTPPTRPVGCGLDFSSAVGSISGTVYEDVNGDSNLSDAVGRPNVNVRLYSDTNNNGVIDLGDIYVSSAVTDSNGNYSFMVSTAGGLNYLLAVDSKSVTPSAGLNGGFTQGDIWAEQTYGDDPATASLDVGSRFGGLQNTVSDNFNQSSTLPVSNTYEHIARVAVNGTNVTNVSFGFSFNVVTNMSAGDSTDHDTSFNRTVQGSLRQFIQNANAIAGANTMRFVPAVAVNAGSWWRLTVTTTLSAITDSSTTIDGTAYSNSNGATVLDNNSGAVGTGGTVGVDAVALSQVGKPELEIVDGSTMTLGLDLQAANATVRKLAIYGFGTTANNNSHANIRVGSFSGALIEYNLIGTTASSFTDPGATRSGGDNVRVIGGSSGVLRYNAIGYSAGAGVGLESGSNSWQVTGNEIRGNGIGNSNLAGIDVNASSSATFTGNLIAGNEGAGIDSVNSSGSNSIVNNTITGNGVGTGASVVTAGIRIYGSGSTVDRNIVNANFGAGVMVTSSSTSNTITKNSIYANGTITNKGGAGPSNQIGIDLLSASDNQSTGTSTFVTINDNGDGDAGGNGLLNFPVVTSAQIIGGSLVLKGYARPGSAIEFFIVAADPSGFGEGQTYLVTLTEGSGFDQDATTGTYTSPINGLNVGTDNTNKFQFAISTPGGVSIGTILTATATLSGATSEFAGNVTVAAAPPDVGLVKSVNPNGSQPPGTDLTYSIAFTNGGGSNASSLVIKDPIPPNTDFKVGSETHDLGTTGLTVVVAYSNDNESTWTYTPVSGGGSAPAGYDRNVTNIRWTFTGNLSQSSPNNNGTVSFITRIR